MLVSCSLLSGALGAVVGIVLTLTRPTCVVSAICRVDPRRAGGCLPVTCDTGPVLLDLWASIGVGVLVGVLIGVAFEVGRLSKGSAAD